jgi:hypothetical protein
MPNQGGKSERTPPDMITAYCFLAATRNRTASGDIVKAMRARGSPLPFAPTSMSLNLRAIVASTSFTSSIAS